MTALDCQGHRRHRPAQQRLTTLPLAFDEERRITQTIFGTTGATVRLTA
ncbi:MAG: hypothetical protein U0521_22705 [Anaerolineae bacterium]